MKDLKINFLLMLIAIVLSVFIFPIGIAFSLLTLKWKFYRLSKYFKTIALSIDQLGNVVMGTLFNKILINKTGYKFGDEDDTISYVLGRNQLTRRLTRLGRLLADTLDCIDKEHCLKAVKIAWNKGSKYCLTKPFV